VLWLVIFAPMILASNAPCHALLRGSFAIPFASGRRACRKVGVSAVKLATSAGADATQAACCGWTILAHRRRVGRGLGGSQSPHMLQLEAAVCVRRSAWCSPVSDACVVIRSVSFRCAFFGSQTACQNNAASETCKDNICSCQIHHTSRNRRIRSKIIAPIVALVLAGTIPEPRWMPKHGACY